MPTIRNNRLAAIALNECKKLNPRKRNWIEPEPVPRVTSTGEYATYTEYWRGMPNYSYAPEYESWFTITADRRVVLYYTSDHAHTIIAPKGCEWSTDSLGLLLQSQGDGIEYHPDAQELEANYPRKWWKQKLAETRSFRRAAKEIAEINDRLIATCRVTMHDSRMAGNCAAGTLAFLSCRGICDSAERRAPFANIPATALDRSDAFQDAAIRAALQRETLVCI